MSFKDGAPTICSPTNTGSIKEGYNSSEESIFSKSFFPGHFEFSDLQEADSGLAKVTALDFD